MTVVYNLKQLAKISEASVVSCIILALRTNVTAVHLRKQTFQCQPNLKGWLTLKV